MLKSYKYRIYPNAAQTQKIEQTIGVCRLVYNLALQTKNDCYNANQTKLSGFDLCNQLAEMKKDYKWMQEVDSQALQASILKLDAAFKFFFNGNGFPKYKSKKGTQSFECPNNARRIDFENGLLTIPKIPHIKIALSRKFNSKIKNVTISRVPSGKYFASILFDNDVELPIKNQIIEHTAVGIDLGIKDFAILSNGKKIINNKFLKSNIKRLKFLQRRASKKKKGSTNQNKEYKKIALCHEKIMNQRIDFLHKLSTAITKQYDTICVENLSIKNMVKNHNLSQSINDASWGEFVRQLKYKAEWNGKNILELPKFEASTKPCSNCGVLNQKLTLGDREWQCPECKAVHDRDINAAINIKKYFFKKTEGYSGLVCGVSDNGRDYEAEKTIS